MLDSCNCNRGGHRINLPTDQVVAESLRDGRARVSFGGMRWAGREGDVLTFDKVCLVGGEGAGKIGTPFVSGASVTAKVVRQIKGPKVVIGKYKRRKNSRRRTGFRAQFTVVQIESING